MKNVKKMVLSGCLTAFAMGLSYLESLLPPLGWIPGIRLGLANWAVLVAMCLLGKMSGFCVSILRILLSAMLFTNPMTLIYSLVGGFLSYLVMALCQKSGFFSIRGISMAGGVAHNIGQLLVAAWIMPSKGLIGYAPVLIAVGTVTGFLLGAAVDPIVRRLDKM